MHSGIYYVEPFNSIFITSKVLLHVYICYLAKEYPTQFGTDKLKNPFFHLNL